MRPDLPSEWQRKPLLEVATLPRGQVDPRREPFRSQILIAPDHIESGTGRVLSYETAEAQGAISGKYPIAPGDVLLSKIRPALRKVVHAEVVGLCSADVYPLRAGPEIDSRYLFAVLLSPEFTAFAESLSGRSGIPKINRSELAEYCIKLPPLAEQRRIAEILEAVDESIRCTERLIAKHRSSQEGLLHRALNDGIRDATWLSLGQLASSTKLGTTIRGNGRGETVPLLKMGNLRWGSIEISRYERVSRKLVGSSFSEFRLADRDLLFNTRNTPDLVGKTAVWREELADAIADNNILRIRLTPPANPHWVCCYMSRSTGRRKIASLATGTTSVAAIYWRDLRTLPIPIPPLDYQVRLEEIWLESDSQIACEQRSLLKLYQLKQAVVDDLLTGRVRGPGR